MIKKFKLNNLDDLMRVWVNTNIETYDFIEKKYLNKNVEFIKEVIPSSDIFVYKENDITKAFVSLIDKYYIAGIFVLSKYHGEGIGNKLISFCKNNYAHLKVEVFIKNEKEINFYKRNNFIIQNKKVNNHTNEIEYVMVYKNRHQNKEFKNFLEVEIKNIQGDKIEFYYDYGRRSNEIIMMKLEKEIRKNLDEYLKKELRKKSIS